MQLAFNAAEVFVLLSIVVLFSFCQYQTCH